MYCKRCGAQNADGSRFCVKCGGELVADAQLEMATGTLGFEEGLTKTLRTFGVMLLSDPMRLKASVADECDHGSREYIVFERNCSQELLGPFVTAVDANDANDVGRACALAAMYLRDQRAEDAEISRSVAHGVANSVATVCGMGHVDLPADVAASQTTPTAVAAAQTASAVVGQTAAQQFQPLAQPQATQQVPVQSPAQTPYDPSQGSGSGSGSKVAIAIGIIAAVATALIVVFVVVPQLNKGPQGSDSTSSVVGSSPQAVSLTFEGAAADGGSMSPLSCASGDTMAVPRCGFTRKGYSFDCWQASDGTKYAPGDSITPTQNITFTAVWKAEECTVSFLGAGADGGSTDSITTTSGSSITLPGCGFYRRGYVFDCWVGEDGNTRNAGAMVSIEGDTTFTAQWKSNTQGSNSSSSSTSSSGTISPSSLPRSWKGSYEGYTTHTSEGVITRSVTIKFTTVGSDGRVQGVVYVGESEMIAGATHGSYNFEGTLDFNTGAIHIYGTTWVDQGGLIGVGGFKGTVNPNNWTMSGEWYDPDGEAENGAWYMRAA